MELEVPEENKPLWSPDSEGDFHLGDLMYNLEELKRKDRKKKKEKEDG